MAQYRSPLLDMLRDGRILREVTQTAVDRGLLPADDPNVQKMLTQKGVRFDFLEPPKPIAGGRRMAVGNVITLHRSKK